MSELSREIAILKGEIIDGMLTSSETKERLRKLEEKYQEDIYLTCTFEKAKMPWTKEYLRELELQSMAGACSKEFILHLAEVSEEVHRTERKKKFLKNVGIALGATIAICSIVVLVIWLIKQLR